MNEDELEMGKILMAWNTLLSGVKKKNNKPSCWISCQGWPNLLSESPELPLPAEMAFQPNELVSPVGIDSGSLTGENNVAHRSEPRKSDS